MTQKIQIPLIHPKNMQENVAPNYEAFHNSSLYDTKRDSLLFPLPRKRHFDETQTSEDNYFKIRDSLGSDTLNEKFNQPFEEKADSVKEKMRINKTKHTSIEYLENFLNLDEKFNDYDGFPHPNLIVRDKIKSSFCIKKKIQYPQFLVSCFEEGSITDEKHFILTGIYERLNIIYFTKDNIIYLWNYNTNDIITYNEISSVISAIHITKPKVRLFSDEISHIIVVATNTNITILLVKQSENGTISIIKSDFYIELEVNYIITCIVSTSQRRIFLGSQNNFLFELDYTNYVSTFFGARKKLFCKEKTNESLINRLLPNLFNLKTFSYCSKLVVDDTRNILYALIYYIESKERLFDLNSVYTSEVKYYFLGGNGKEFKEIGSIKQKEIKDKDRFSEDQNDINYVILDMYVADRKESKYFELVLITKLGLRAYISFEYEDLKLNLKPLEMINNFNLVYQYPKSKHFMIFLKYTPEHSKHLILENKYHRKSQKEVKEDMFFDQITFIGKDFFVFFHDKLENRSFLKTIQQDQSMGIKSHLENDETRSLETYTKLLSLDHDKNISFIIKKKPDVINPDFISIFKFDDEEYITDYFYSPIKPINYQDSFSHLSNCSMHIYANQQFIKNIEYIISTSTEVLFVYKLRPIDELFEIIHENMSNEDIFWKNLQSIIDEHTIYETTYMLLVIMVNKNFCFYIRDTDKEDIIEVRNSDEIIEFCKRIYLTISLKNEYAIGINYNTRNYKKDNLLFIIGEPFRESQSIKINNISYSLYMYLARVGRLFLEENIFIADRYNDYYIEGFKINHLKYLILLIENFESLINSLKNHLLININEQNKHISNLKETGLNDFLVFQKDFDHIFFICSIYKQTFIFLQTMYEVSNIRKHLSKINVGLFNRILDLKIKDIIYNGSTNLTIKEWIEEYFDTIIYEKDIKYLNFKLQELSTQCPLILSASDRELIIANILIKYSQKSFVDEVNKKSILTKVINLLVLYPECVSIERVSNILGQTGEIKEIVNIAARKAVYLKKLLNSESYTNRSDEARGLKTQYYNEFKECLYYIFKILSELSSLIRSSDLEYKSDAPENIASLFKNKKYSLDFLINMQTLCINEILQLEEEFLHDLLFDHLNELDMLDLLNQFKSPFLEKYLKKMVDINRKDPKKYQSLFKLQFTMKEYFKAFQTVLNLINFVNHEMLDKKDYVSINDRKSFCNSALICLEHLIQKKDDKIQHELLQHKIKINEIKNVLTLQNKLIERISFDLNSMKIDIEKKIPLENSLAELQSKIVGIKDLYFIANELQYYDILIDIFFMMYKLKDKTNFNDLTQREICLTYEKYLTYLISKEIKYPYSVVEYFKKLFIENLHDIPDKQNVFSKLIPLNYLTSILEKRNKFLYENECDYENASIISCELKMNAFWFISFLKTKLNFKFHYIYKIYEELVQFFSSQYNEKSSEEDDLLIIHLTLCLFSILKNWCNVIEKGYQMENKQSELIKTNCFYEELEEFQKRKEELREFMMRSYEFTTNKNLRYLITPQSLVRVRNFQKSVENRLELVINILLKRNSLGEDEKQDVSVSKTRLVKSLHNISTSIREDVTSLSNILEEENKNESFLKLVKSDKKPNSLSKISSLDEEF